MQDISRLILKRMRLGAYRSIHEDAEMSSSIREASTGSRWSRGQDFMGKRLTLLAIRLLVSVNLLYAAIFSSLQRCQIRWPCSRRCRKWSTGWYLRLYSG